MAQKQYSEQTGREEALEREVAELRDTIDRMGDDSKGDSVTINQLERTLTVKTQADLGGRSNEKAKEEADELRSKVQGQYDDIVMLERDLASSRTTRSLLCPSSPRP